MLAHVYIALGSSADRCASVAHWSSPSPVVSFLTYEQFNFCRAEQSPLELPEPSFSIRALGAVSILTVSMADVARQELDELDKEVTAIVDRHKKVTDSYFWCQVKRSIDGITFRGVVTDIELGTVSKAKLYRIQ